MTPNNANDDRDERRDFVLPVAPMSSVAIYPGGRDRSPKSNRDDAPAYSFAVHVDPEVPGGRWVEVIAGDLPCQIAVRLGATTAGSPLLYGCPHRAARRRERVEV